MTITIQQVQIAVTARYSLPPIAMSAESRRRAWARPRQIAMALAHELTGSSYVRIGKAFGGRDHTTVLYAIKTVRNNETLRREAAELRATLCGPP